MKNITVIDYLLGHLTDTEKQTFEQEMAINPALQKEVEELKQVWSIVQSAEKEPTAQMDNAFYELLEDEKQLTEKSNKKPIVSFYSTFFHPNFFRYAAMIAGLGLAFGWGRYSAPTRIEYVAVNTPTNNPTQKTIDLQPVADNIPKTHTAPTAIDTPRIDKEIASLKKEMKMTQELVILALLKDQSAAERLKGVHYVNLLSQPKPAIVEALLKTLHEDESVNVRISAIETLQRFREEQKVKNSLVAHLQTTAEPIEQTILIESLVQMRAVESLPILEKLKQDENTDVYVRNLARSGIGELSMVIQ